MDSDSAHSTPSPSPGAEDSAALLPIRRVVLFKHGVGAFERQGKVHGNRTIRLGFQARELNDVLKSMTALDRNGGRIASIGYESGERLEHKLERVHLSLGEHDALTQLLRQIKGAAVEVAIGTTLHTGSVVGVEKTSAPPPPPGSGNGGHRGPKPTRDRLCLLGEDARLRSFDLLDVTSIRLLDPALQDELGYLLRTLFAAQREDRKHISIAAHGEGERELVVHYVIEAPVWKTSYRILLAEDQPVLLQGWALVDNTQEEDWTDVELNLVAGLPISFTHDLQTPRRQQRPEVQIDESPAYAPPELEQAQILGDEAEMFDAEEAGAPIPMAAAAPKRMRARGLIRKERAESMGQVKTSTRGVGNLIEYRIDHPVTVRRGESALVPLLQSEIGGERVLIYNSEVREGNPMAAVWLHNNTGLTLEGGPATVLDGSGADYVGEAMLDTLVADDRQLVPYSVELGCSISLDHRSGTTDIQSVRVHSGQLIFERYRRNERIYNLNNKLGSKRKILIDHRFDHGGELIDTPAPIETTDNFYRFECTVEAKSSSTFTVVERTDAHEVHDLRHTPAEALGAWIQARQLPKPIRKQVEVITTHRTALDRFLHQDQQLESEIAEAFADQERLRNNLASLGSSESERGLRDRYVAELEKSEDTLGRMRTQQRDVRDQRDAAQRALDQLLESLDLHAPVLRRTMGQSTLLLRAAPPFAVVALAVFAPGQTGRPLVSDWSVAAADGPQRPAHSAYQPTTVDRAFEHTLGTAFDGVAWYRRTLRVSPSEATARLGAAHRGPPRPTARSI